MTRKEETGGHRPSGREEIEKTRLVLLAQYKREYKAAKCRAADAPGNRQVRSEYKRAKRRYKNAVARRNGGELMEEGHKVADTHTDAM